MTAVYKAIATVAKLMSQSGISKERRNKSQEYNFRGIDDVLNALSSALTEAGLLILPRVISRECLERTTAKGGAIFYVTVHVEFDLVATEDGSMHTVVTYGEAMDSADKATNKAMSAAYKYLALLTFCIPTEATPDTDADYTTHEVKSIQPDPIPSYVLTDWLNAISDAKNMEELKSLRETGMESAKQAQDSLAYKEIDSASRKRKKEMEKQ